MSDSTKAVFLSYASQDAEAAKRICEALRAAGVEVWFDQSELVGGDAWDQKIRRQIKDCALLIPIISANTQARTEGYFRLEWRLADQRTHLMAKGRPFLVPVVIDDTRDGDAHVPDSFTEVQWTRLRDGLTTPAFGEQVRLLLDRGIAFREPGTRPSVPDSPQPSPPPKTRRAAQWWWLVIGFGVAVALFPVWRERSRALPSPSTPPVPAGTPLSPARQLVAKAWEQINRPGLSRVDLEVADDLAGRAAVLDPTDADVVAVGAQVDTWFVYYGFDATAERKEQARRKAMRALQLAPQNFEARLAQACYLVRNDYSIPPETAVLAETLLGALLREVPEEPRALEALGTLQERTGRGAAARAVFEQLARNPAFAAQAWNDLGWSAREAGEFKMAENAADRSISLQPYWSNLSLRAWLAISWRGDPDKAKAAIDRIPLAVMQEDFVISTATWVHWYRRDGAAILRMLKGVSRDWLSSTLFNGPMAAYAAFGHQLAGQKEAEEVQWRAALQVVERRLTAAPNSPALVGWQGFILLELGQKEDGEKKLRLADELSGVVPQGYWLAIQEVQLKRWDEAIAALEVGADHRENQVMPALLRRDPHCDALREMPRFKALLARLESDPRFFTDNVVPAVATAVPAHEDKSVAVLAFTNLSDDKANEYFSDGISEELLNVLAKVPGLKVTARTSSFHFKGKDTPISEIARQLGVAYVVEGSVRKQGDKVRVTAQLIKAADGFHVWSDTFTRDLKDVFAVQDEIAALIAGNLSLKLGARPVAASVNPEAFQLYMQGRQAWGLRTNEGFDLAEQLLNRALALAPDFARAQAALADVAVLRAVVEASIGRYDQRNSPEQARLVAQIRRVLALDPDLAEAHATLGFTLKYGWDFAGGERELRRAVALNPNYATGHHWLAGVLLCTGQMDDALAEFKLASELDPLSSRILDNYGSALYFAGRYPEALTITNRALALQPSSLQALRGKAWILLALGRAAEAVALARQLPEGDIGNKIGILAQAGFKSEAETAFAQLEAGERTYWGMLLALGRSEEALAALENAASLDTTDAIGLLFDPLGDAIRGDPRFVKCLTTVGWTEAHARAQAWRKAHPPEKPETKP